jgi:hypothetical protein
LEECRDRLFDNVVRQIVLETANVVTLSVANDTDDPVADVEVTARVPRGGLLVYTSAPSAKPPPELPKWPSPLDDWQEKIGPAQTAEMTAASQYDFGSMHASVSEDDDCFEIHWNVGNLLARTSSTRGVHIIAGRGASEEIEVQLSARSTSHRGVSRATSR